MLRRRCTFHEKLRKKIHYDKWHIHDGEHQLELALGRKLLNNEVVAQKLFVERYRALAAEGRERLPAFNDVGFRKYSQFEEDGILLFIFALVPPLNRKCVEICAGNGRVCMTAILIINHGWWGYLFDGNEHSVEAGREFFAKCPDTSYSPPQFTHAWITAENVNEEIEKSGVNGPIDLLSLDMDGMEYWVWKAIRGCATHRWSVCETVELDSGRQSANCSIRGLPFTYQSEDFRGASLAAMCSWADEKGYRLIGTHRFGFNAFFMKNGVGEGYFPEVDPTTCLNDPVTTRLRVERWPGVSKLDWVEV